MNKNNLFLKISVTIWYVAMITTNYLANALPIWWVTTGEASDSFSNLFTPAWITFSIWGLIYLLLLGFCIYQFNFNKKESKIKKGKIINTVGKYFLITSIANIIWIFAWHYGIIWLSVLIMLVLLFFLIKIADVVNKGDFSLSENIFIRVPFSVYFGWVTVATIANITVLLVSISWNRFSLSEAFWTVIILLVGAWIGIARTLKDKNIFYGSVLVWAYCGILIKHLSETWFNWKYPSIITTVALCVVLFLITIGYVSYKKNRIKKISKA